MKLFTFLQGRLQPDAVEGQRRPRLSSGRKKSKQRTNLFYLCLWLCTVLQALKKAFSGLLCQEATTRSSATAEIARDAKKTAIQGQSTSSVVVPHMTSH